MALRIDTAVIKGELDNTVRGRVVVRLWLAGREGPVALDLSGDALADLAGRTVVFENPNPLPQKDAAVLAAAQEGIVGDITVLPPSIEAEREHSRFYLEWFTTEHGRCVIESEDFVLTALPPAWSMDAEEEQAQQMANMHAMRDYLAGVIQRRESTGDDEAPHETTEEEWEQQLRASDRLTDAAMEAEEKYGHGDDSRQKVAFVMGWDHILDDMADAREGVEPSENDSEEKKRRREWIAMMNEVAAEVDREMESEPEKVPWDDDDEKHPLLASSREFMHRVLASLDDAGIDDERSQDRDHPLDRFVRNVMQIGGKLAGALSSEDGELRMDRGYVLAIARRCLNWANEALAALQELTAGEYGIPHRELFEQWRAGLFQLRDGITDLRQELHDEG